MPAAALLALTLAGCATSSDTPATATAGPADRTLTVLAAASLRDVFTELGDEFEDTHPGVTVRLSFAGSNDLADQVLAGAPADVLATADEATMARVVDAGDAEQPTLFASNALVVVVPPDNPAGITGWTDLADPDAKVVICAVAVPCGTATAQVEASAGEVHAVSEEASVTDVLAKVTSGEADAGVVYGTDAALAGDDVRVVPTPETADVVNRYPIALLPTADDAALAGEFVALVTGTVGREALAADGFGAP
ncbi:molybdate ABC transporter substrate-binding protein [Sediminihabitans luteus]|uniref:molybdate ABC transporter substrate-binding protein n=1 Tax=Sediminihabitans luteus TaxID=1138585 RepID=UPI001FD1A34D|nr:molybdate ABC transporter substrate-binding protein [Sediminihabitans luteus]